ncbi:hypothetical protein [Phenylobacterium deserti]|uniref:STAS domain-containing protein n=1 Tax=Phenylobacterium deserti TaxID=1914756 RepID=A0A328ASF1_9CAUL|nr:hypothetical protein [Phenylobacterium deserti]RAK57547.1 hypothetical protein DJ018_06335 [Phenylobacterium deserti]
MTVRLDGEIVRLEGPCRVEEAETLVALLQAGERGVDLSRCQSVHGAVVQVLVAFAPRLVGEPDDQFLRDLLLPALRGQTAANT